MRYCPDRTFAIRRIERKEASMMDDQTQQPGPNQSAMVNHLIEPDEAADTDGHRFSGI